MKKIYVFTFIALFAELRVLTSGINESMVAHGQLDFFVTPGSEADQAALVYLAMQ